jgi:hypothetical protein
MLQHLGKVANIDPLAAHRTLDEVHSVFLFRPIIVVIPHG